MPANYQIHSAISIRRQKLRRWRLSMHKPFSIKIPNAQRQFSVIFCLHFEIRQWHP